MRLIKPRHYEIETLFQSFGLVEFRLKRIRLARDMIMFSFPGDLDMVGVWGDVSQGQDLCSRSSRGSEDAKLTPRALDPPSFASNGRSHAEI